MTRCVLPCLALCWAAWLPAADKDETPPAGFGNGPGRNLVSPEKGITTDFSVKAGKEKNVKWQATLGNTSYGGPVVAGGRVFVGTNNERPRDPKVLRDKGVMMCFDEKTGDFLWQIVHDKLPGGEKVDAAKQGIPSNPAVEGGRIWYVSNRCEFVCADAEKGKIVWSVDMIKKYDVFPCQLATSSPLIVGDLVCALTGNGVDMSNSKLVSPKAPAIVALDKKTGKPAWQFTQHNPVLRGQWSSPAAAKVNGKWQIIVPAGDGWLYGLSADKGELLWKFDCNPKKATPYKFGESKEQSFLVGVPVVVDGKCYIATGQEPDDGQGIGHLWCVDITKKPKNKEKDLSPVNDNFDPKAAVNKDSGLVWHYGGKRVKPKKDETDWIFGRTLATVAVHDGLVYATEMGGWLHCLDAKTGEKQWVHDMDNSTWCSPFVVDGKVLCGTDSGEFLVYKAGRKLERPKKINVGGQIKVPPAVSNGVLFVNNGLTLYAIK